MNQPICFEQKRMKGFTLLEVLIATTVTLLLMLGLAQVFKVLGNSITQGRAGLELNNRLRNVTHRIRADLNNLTCAPRPPIKAGSGQGYLKYYDGPGSDATFSTNPLLNRFGDVDDIFMATVKAQDSWFTGKIPRFILERRQPTSAAELTDSVTISSQFAEVVIFAEPTPTSRQLNPSTAVNVNRDPIRLAADPLGGFEDSFLGSDSFPDSFRLHYRVLLVRPDLNLPQGVLPGLGNVNPLLRAMVAGPETIEAEFQIQPPPSPVPTGYLPIIPESTSASRITLPSPICDMWRVHQYCDLSVRRVYNPNDGLAGSLDYVAANSLDSLIDPINRFAHVVLQARPGYVTMPVLALSEPVTYQRTLLNRVGSLTGLPVFVNNTTPNYFAGGFLHPAFMLLGPRSGEDILATDLLAFDIKAFDPAAPIISNFGENGVNEFGSVTSDDLILKPGDPGFSIPGLAGLSSGTSPIAFGEFVDLAWGSQEKLEVLPTPINIVDQVSKIQSILSGVVVQTNLPYRTRTPAILKSGLSLSDNLGLRIYQPAYDTYSDHYEKDGIWQGTISGLIGTVQYIGPGTPHLADQGTDGIDNNSDGTADDIGERETSPPFATNLRGIQISVRLEDRATKQFKQMSTVKEFITR